VKYGRSSPKPCRSKELSEQTHSFWFWRRRRYICNECGTTLEQVNDKYKLVCVADSENAVWQKYAGKALYSREWANIANGGLSDDELVASWTQER
jgi:hypothetical protein